ncbi:penicillin-binding protein 1C [Roseomonas populi]|uniref:peptidoglycan glycosyltransferase n=1 Tax=Roseomonas populi TaxID=3121582 RepID=A0ABT1X833_9PROT|nr:penicillin-binding protein 1C [Roseomonas pecuniae]MCR0984268.1 penicillin-binding protein 1C [Roseomonas pecuniae]
MRSGMGRFGLWVALVLGPAAGALVLFLVLDRVFPPDLSRLETVGRVVVDREGRTLSALPAPGGVWRLPVGAEEVPPHLVGLLVAAEDRRFWRHPGVDPIALGRAAFQWARAGRVVSGGSTLSMQAARLLEPRPRNLRSKAIEAFRAVQLEWRLGKPGVLRAWLTLAPMGGNLEGVRAGALAWFGRPVERVSVAEAALLVAVPRRPEALRPDRHPVAARAARDAVLVRRGALALPEVERVAALAEGTPDSRRRMPGLAPHLAREVARGAVGDVVRTSLDAGTQRVMEGIAREALAGLPERASVAIVVADLRSREARAVVGGEWLAEGRAGALDLTRAVRSPGSALKPLLYAMAFDRGLARPGSVMEDLPRLFGDWAPENFARGFSGRVTAASALRQSLNLPAVALMEALGPIRFASAMKRLGAPPRMPPGAGAALPLALGGAGVTLRELVGVMAAVGDGGRGGPLRVLPGGAPFEGEAVVRAPAADAVAGILTQPFPGGGPEGVAWKTGTSWGGRDALAVGFDARHAAGVWVGRPDGTAIPGATGRSLALPVLARVFSALPSAPRAAEGPVIARGAGAAPVDGLRLLFPPSGAVIDEGAVTIRAAGGRRPFTFLVDGVPVASGGARREAGWVPPGPGFYRVTVLDAEGGVVSAAVRVRGVE